jgi:hypothetical protein
MKIIKESSLCEYAELFWNRQRKKEDPGDRDALTDIDRGGDPRWWLGKKYDYKLPRPDNDIVSIVLLDDQKEVESLLIHKYMVDNEWMQASNLVPEPKTRVLRDLAKITINRGYFSKGCWDNTHHKYYRKWMEKGSLENVIKGDERPLIESVGPNEYEIVDGWGRLLPFVALLEKFTFHPIECFVAWKAYHLHLTLTSLMRGS